MNSEQQPEGQIEQKYTLASQGETENPLEAIHSALVKTSEDLSLKKRDAWIYGIVCGWDDPSYQELAPLHNWTTEDIERNKRLHTAYITAWILMQKA